MIKKIFYVGAIVLILSFAILPSFSLATVNLTTEVLKPTSVILKGTGLTPGQTVMLWIVNKNNTTPPTPSYSEQHNFTVNNDGWAFSSFTGLTPNRTYTGHITATSGIVGSIDFSTPKSDEKIIKAFSFSGLAPRVNGVVGTSTVSATVPFGRSIIALIPTIMISNQATISPASGVPQDFTNPVTYTLTAEDGSTGSYTVTVSVGSDPNSNPNPNPTSGADSGLVTCGTTANPTPCDFNGLMETVNKVVNFFLFRMALPIAAIMFAYAGFLLVTSGGEAGKRTKAKDIFMNVALGLVFAAAAWLIIHTVLNIVGFDGSWIGL